ncbi:alanine--glyoxylate aminotransferase 2, mitochondrial [Trichonephila inaurata madagascariensis]|uniref:Alanine--glyoxylate aminotransferase 2, mitochondrial n=1 Tax=Trichonephila inaurata madagascariensis TaxID=2747483 RepID=A0A8X6JPP0_9ARAC|nr:alanine--glyoxylate aminotransferase 2, mitochondrial [Trichonephila inaurata madagascariensis]
MLCKILRVSFPNKWISSKNLTFRFCSSHVEVPTLPSVSFEPKPYKGPNYNDVLNSRNTNISPFVRLMYKEPVMINQGYMQYVWDHTGKRFLDMFGGIVTVSVGHCHPKVTKAAVDQMHKLWHVTNLYMHPELHKYAKKLTDRLPGDLKVCYFCNSGSEANDLAIQLARLYTGAFDVISLRNAYHGDTPYSIGLCGIGTWKHSFPNGFGMHQPLHIDLSYRRHVIPEADSCSYLGVTFDRKFTENIVNRISNRMTLLKRLADSMWGCSNHTLSITYKLFILPILTYCCEPLITASRSITEILENPKSGTADHHRGC